MKTLLALIFLATCPTVFSNKVVTEAVTKGLQMASHIRPPPVNMQSAVRLATRRGMAQAARETVAADSGAFARSALEHANATRMAAKQTASHFGAQIVSHSPAVNFAMEQMNARAMAKNIRMGIPKSPTMRPALRMWLRRPAVLDNMEHFARKFVENVTKNRNFNEIFADTTFGRVMKSNSELIEKAYRQTSNIQLARDIVDECKNESGDNSFNAKDFGGTTCLELLLRLPTADKYTSVATFLLHSVSQSITGYMSAQFFKYAAVEISKVYSPKLNRNAYMEQLKLLRMNATMTSVYFAGLVSGKAYPRVLHYAAKEYRVDSGTPLLKEAIGHYRRKNKTEAPHHTPSFALMGLHTNRIFSAHPLTELMSDGTGKSPTDDDIKQLTRRPSFLRGSEHDEQWTELNSLADQMVDLTLFNKNAVDESYPMLDVPSVEDIEVADEKENSAEPFDRVKLLPLYGLRNISFA